MFGSAQSTFAGRCSSSGVRELNSEMSRSIKVNRAHSFNHMIMIMIAEEPLGADLLTFVGYSMGSR